LVLESALELAPVWVLALVLALVLASALELAPVWVLALVLALALESLQPACTHRTNRNNLGSLRMSAATPCLMPCLNKDQDSPLSCQLPMQPYQYSNDFEGVQSGRWLRKLPSHQLHEHIPQLQHHCKQEQTQITSRIDTWWLGKSRQLRLRLKQSV
jgi:hypothetical protein